MRILLAVTFTLMCVSAFAAPPSTPTPLPPSAVIFDGLNTFNDSAERWDAPVSVPQDGAWLLSRASNGGTYMSCSHRYAAELIPNFSPYPPPIFQLGVDTRRTEACFSNLCYSCYTRWGNQITYDYHTTAANPGFLPAGSGVISVRTLTGGGQNDTLHLSVKQINRDAMEAMTIFLSRADDDPVPLEAEEIKSAYWIADGMDRVAVVPEFNYGTDKFPAGPGLTYIATWDDGTSFEPLVARSTLMPHAGHTILGVPIPKLSTGTHTFTLKATLPSGKTYTASPMAVFVYAQNIYVTVEGNFAPKKPIDQAPHFVPGSTMNGSNVDLRTAPQALQLNILVGRGSSGTFDVKLKNVTRYPGIAMNYPIGVSDTTADMDFGNGLTELTGVPIPKGGAPKVVQLPLYVRDYGASATIEVTMPYRKTTFTTRRRIPHDADSNLLPDAGWTAIGNVAITSAKLTATADDDPAAGAVGTDAAVTGDGLSNFEEFRGFFVAGGYVRLNPAQKEVFVDVDPEFLLAGPAASPLNALLTLTPRILFLEPGEVDGEDLLSRNLLRAQGVVNPNRATVPVAHARPQRAVRLISQATLPPAVHLAGPNIDVPVWQVGVLGATMSDDVLDVDVLNAPGNVGTIETPMRTQFSEVYTRTFTNLGVNTTFSYPYHYDAAGEIVPRCTSANQAGCDVWDTTHNLIIPSLQDGGWGILYTVPDPAHDPVEHYSLQARNCGSDTQIVGGLTTIQMERLKGIIAAHEMGHAMKLAHVGDFATECGDIMFDDEASWPRRRAMSSYVPQPTGFSSRNHAMLRLWQQ